MYKIPDGFVATVVLTMLALCVQCATDCDSGYHHVRLVRTVHSLDKPSGNSLILD